MKARILYFTTIVLGLVFVVVSGATGNPIGLMAALCFLAAAFFKTTATRITVGVIYGLFAIQIFLFTGIAVSASGTATQVILLFAVSAVLAFLSLAYFTYKPLKLFLGKTKA